MGIKLLQAPMDRQKQLRMGQLLTTTWQCMEKQLQAKKHSSANIDLQNSHFCVVETQIQVLVPRASFLPHMILQPPK
jgi:hypothetical protein